MQPGELWQHRKTREYVRIEMALGGLLSFSIYKAHGVWVMCQDVWDEKEFRRRFKRIDLHTGGVS